MHNFVPCGKDPQKIDVNARAFGMLKKSLLVAAAASGMFLAANAAQAANIITNYTTVTSFVAGATGSGAPANQVADNVNWGVFANVVGTQHDGGTIPTPRSMTTSAGETVTAKSGDGNAFTTYVQGQGDWLGQFKTGTTILGTGATLSSQPITLSFATPLSGLGVDLQTADAGAYSFTITAFNVNAQGVSHQIGSVTNSVTNSTGAFDAANPGTVIFAGLTSNQYNISYVQISASGANLADGFAIDTSLIYHTNINGTSNPDPSQGGTSTPEPGTLALLGAGLAALGAVRRRRNRAA
jgi:hypothetical protein